MEPITIKDVARISGFGVSTVSRAMNNHADINPETKSAIMKVIKETNFVPNNNARNLKRTQSKSIAVLIKGISNPFFSGMLKIFEKEIQSKKYSFILHHVEEKDNEIDVAISLTNEKKLQGIIFLGGSFTHNEEKLKQLKIPYVLSTVFMPSSKLSYSAVSVDDKRESFRLVDYLCKTGHKKIAILCYSPEDMSISNLRLEGYKKALLENNIEIDENLIVYMDSDIESYSAKNGYFMTKYLLNSNIDFTALFAISDNLAIGACKAILETGKKIPDDYSVAGFDGIDISYFYNPSITTMKQPTSDMAEETIRILFDMIDKKITYEIKIFPTDLVLRESTKILIN